jgi:peptidoglycan/xylan/chitin deacetylase (PgdA/CDA1 family)
MQTGIFAISLDHEQHWGVSANRTVESYRTNLDNERAAISQMLDLFKKHEIHVTWAVVGMLFCKDRTELMQWFSKLKLPRYENKSLSNFELAKHVGFNEKDDPYHFGYEIIQWIQSVPHQQIGTHTFSHYYCIENGQDIESFESDLKAAIEIGKCNQVIQKSIVYPRNQYSDEHLDVSYKAGIRCYRGVQKRKMYHFRPVEKKRIRALRLIDCYIGISGDNTYDLKYHKGEKLYDIPATRFFRAYDSKFKFIEKLRLARITKEMTYAAKNKRLYHLWWHPHNFGANMEKNLQNLEHILLHYSYLNKKYGFKSMNMEEIYDLFLATEDHREFMKRSTSAN